LPYFSTAQTKYMKEYDIIIASNEPIPKILTWDDDFVISKKSIPIFYKQYKKWRKVVFVQIKKELVPLLKKNAHLKIQDFKYRYLRSTVYKFYNIGENFVAIYLRNHAI